MAWYIPAALRRTDESFEIGLGRAGAFVEGKIKQNISAPSPPPSDPGNPPHKKSGALRRHVGYHVGKTFFKGSFLSIGIKRGPVKYGKRLEFGFSGTVKVPSHKREIGKGKKRRMVDVSGYSYFVTQAARPFVRPTLFVNRRSVLKIIARGGR